LNNGNHIEILTARSAWPSPMWLNYVVTGKARSAIRVYLKHQRTDDAVKLGKQLLERALTSLGVNTRLRTRQKVELLERIGKEDWTELLADIGTGRRLPTVIAQQLLPEEDAGRPQKFRNEPLVIKGAEGMMVRYGQCCRPIPGDRIVGLFSRGRGIVIHGAKCSNTKRRGKSSDNCLWRGQMKSKVSLLLIFTLKRQIGQACLPDSRPLLQTRTRISTRFRLQNAILVTRLSVLRSASKIASTWHESCGVCVHAVLLSGSVGRRVEAITLRSHGG